MKWLYLAALAGFAIWMYGCAGKVVPPTQLNTEPNPEVVIAGDSDPVPPKLLNHIIHRTDGFCKEEGRPGVKRVTIRYIKAELATTVLYLCIGEAAGVGEEGIPSPVRVIEEVISLTREIHYCTIKAAALGFC